MVSVPIIRKQQHGIGQLLLSYDSSHALSTALTRMNIKLAVASTTALVVNILLFFFFLTATRGPPQPCTRHHFAGTFHIPEVSALENVLPPQGIIGVYIYFLIFVSVLWFAVLQYHNSVKELNHR